MLLSWRTQLWDMLLFLYHTNELLLEGLLHMVTTGDLVMEERLFENSPIIFLKMNEFIKQNLFELILSEEVEKQQ
jgi:hypothetical protein